MKKIIILFYLFLSGCYLANGSPNADRYWLKDGKKISYDEMEKCSDKAFSNLPDRYYELYKKKKEIGFIEFHKNKANSEEYQIYLDKAYSLLDKCYYDLGYRFKAPLYWCLAQDGSNTKICINNLKHRN